MKLIRVLISAGLLICCTYLNAQEAGNQIFGSQKEIGRLENKSLVEVSGLEVSKENEGYFWTHNDSGDGPKIYLIDSLGNLKLTVTLDSALHIDWEDMTTCSMGGTNYLFIGDIGDNLAKRPFLMIYRLKEPKWDGLQTEISISEFDYMTFTYAEGARDAETLMVDPLQNQLVILSKRDKQSMVYQFDYVAEEGKILKSLGQMSISGFTAGDINASGDILIKDYNNIYLFQGAPNQSAAKTLMTSKYQMVPYKPEPQGESIVWNKSGNGFFTVSEKRFPHSKQIIYYFSN